MSEHRPPFPFVSPRRSFLKSSAAAFAASALGATTSGQPAGASDEARASVIDEYDPANVKLARRVPASIGDEDMLFLKQMGLRWVRVDFSASEATYDAMARLQDRFAEHEIRIYSGVYPIQGSKTVGLGLPGRDEEIERYRHFLRDLGKLDIPVSGYAFHPGNTYSTGQATQRGYTSREFDLETFRNKVEKQAFDRVYPAEEMWDNYAYFMKAVLPAAEEADVKMALHPDDPPVAMMNGVAKLFVHYDGYRRAEEIAGESRHWGVLLCVGTWSEGGERTGKSAVEMIRDFGGRGKLFAIHFRNVSSPLPRFHETFPDDGYVDLYAVMKALRDMRFNGTAIPDHIPHLAGDVGLQRAGAAYCIAYMRALLRRANAEVG